MTETLRDRLERRRPGYPYSMGRTYAIYAGLMVTILLAALDQTIVATAMPSIASSLGGLSNYAWVFTAYLLCQTVMIPIYGKLGDAFGRRRLFFVSIPLFLAGSALCGLAQTMPELIVFRGIQGLGAGGVIPLAMATTGEIVPSRDRGRFVAPISGAFAAASILGPTVGGLIVDHTSWRWIFYVNLPIGGLALLVVALTMPDRAVLVRRALDLRGAVLLTITTVSLLLAVSWGGGTYAWGSIEVVAAVVCCLAAGTALAVVERRVADPILPFEALRQPIVGTAALSTALFAMCTFGATTFVPLFAQGVIGTSATSSGAVLIPQTLGAVTATIVAGQWVSRTGRYRRNALLGPVVLGAGMMLLFTMGVGTSIAQAGVYMVLVGAGGGMMGLTFMVASQNAVPLSTIGSATASIQFSRAIGTTVGVALFGAIVNHGLPASFKGRGVIVHRLPEAARHELASALHPAFLLGAVLCVVMLVAIYIGLEERPLRSTLDDLEAGAGPTLPLSDAT